MAQVKIIDKKIEVENLVGFSFKMIPAASLSPSYLAVGAPNTARKMFKLRYQLKLFLWCVLDSLVKMIDGEHHAQQVDQDPQHVEDVVPVGTLQTSQNMQICWTLYVQPTVDKLIQYMYVP